MTASGNVVEVDGLRSVYGRQVVHEGLDLTVQRGEILGVIGGSGAGKSVLLRSIVGLRQPDGGRIRVLGREVTGPAGQSALAEVKLHFGLMFQDGALFSSLTVLENVKVPLLERHHLPAALMDQLALLKICLTGLPPDTAHKYPAQLSGGMRKRAGLARALALDPEILFLDEPTSGLDPIRAAGIDELIHTLKEALDLTVFLVTHDLDSLYAICDRVAVLADGHIVAVGRPSEVEKVDHPWIRECFQGPRGRAAQLHGHAVEIPPYRSMGVLHGNPR
jgi:phospholipid/cholesterol/gamma-HCH transport system ATP-binding protein